MERAWHNRGGRAVARLLGGLSALCLVQCSPTFVKWYPPCHGASDPRPGPGETVLDPDPESGFVVLTSRFVPFVKPRTFREVRSPAELQELWADWELRGPVPDADFAKYRVLLFTDLDLCFGGLGGSELVQVFVREDGQIRFELAPDPIVRQCLDSEYVDPTALYVVEVARDRMAATRAALWGGERAFCDGAGASSDAGRSELRRAVPGASECTQDKPPEHLHAGIDSVLRPPALGGVSLEYLSDRSPVFVVHHLDGTFDVVAGDAPSVYDFIRDPHFRVIGLREAVRWSCEEGRFRSTTGSYDEFGVPVLALTPRPLDLYRWTQSADGSLVVPSGARHSGYGPRRVTPRRAFVWARDDELVPFWDGEKPKRLRDVSQAPVGTYVHVIATLDMVPGRSRLCDYVTSSPELKCVLPTLPTPGVTTWWPPVPDPSFSRVFIPGPFAGRFTPDGLSDLTAAPIFELVTGDDDIRPRAWPSIQLKPALSAVGAIERGVVAAGGVEATLGGRVSPWAHRPAEFLLGDLAVDARVRLIAGPGPPELFAGLSVFFARYDLVRRWEYPSWPTLVVPEAGVGHAGDRTFPYVSGSVPVEYRFESPRLRRHPLDAHDVLGVRFSPFVIVPAPISQWMAGMSVGLSLW